MSDRATSQIRTHGQAIVEFALLLPIVFLLALGIVYFSQLYSQNQLLTNATSAVARFVSICDTATSGDANGVGDGSAPSLDNGSNKLTFSYHYNATSPANIDAGCAIPSGTSVVVTGSALASPGTFNLGLTTIHLPTLSDTVTVVEQ